MKRTAVIMAGGKGERFWPKSRAACPKQFLSLTSDGKTMLQLTVERLKPFIAVEDVYIATNSGYFDMVCEQLPQLPSENILCEPQARNTAPCIAYAAQVIRARYGDALMFVLPSDHIIKNKVLFQQALQTAQEVAEAKDGLVTLGITPNYPETGYGYIQFDHDGKGLPQGVFPVERFVEKPDLETARQYVDGGNYLWNSGMFAWKASVYMEKVQRYMPELATAMEPVYQKEKEGGADVETVTKAFEASPSVSVDYGIMERSDRIFTIPGSFGWDDVGSWPSLSRINQLDAQGNYLQGNVVAIGCESCIMVGDKRLVAAVGMEALIVVDTPDALLICDRNNAQQVKDIVQKLKEDGQAQYL